MLSLRTWEIVLLTVAGYLATVSLVRLMRSRRDQLLAKLRRDFADEQQRLAEQRQIEEAEQAQRKA